MSVDADFYDLSHLTAGDEYLVELYPRTGNATSDDTLASGLTAAFTVTTGTDTIDAVAHGLADGARVRFTTTDTLPAGLKLLVSYFVRNKTDDDFQVSLTAAGSIIDITSAGSGTHTFLEQTAISELQNAAGDFTGSFDDGAGGDLSGPHKAKVFRGNPTAGLDEDEAYPLFYTRYPNMSQSRPQARSNDIPPSRAVSTVL